MKAAGLHEQSIIEATPASLNSACHNAHDAVQCGANPTVFSLQGIPSSMRLVITGASGFIGQQIIPLLSREGLPLLLVGRDVEYLQQLFPQFSCLEYKDLEQSLEESDSLLHLAVMNNDQEGTLEDFRQVNVELLKQVLEMSKRAGIQKFLYLDTVHSNNPTTSYSISKSEAVKIIDAEKDLSVKKITIPAVYGDAQFKGRLSLINKIPAFLRTPIFQILRSMKPTIHVNKVAQSILEHLEDSRPSPETISDEQQGNWFFHIGKRAVDWGFALIIVVLFWWLLVVIWVAIKLTARGTPIFAQERVGQFGESFTCYKFRTMKPETRQAGTHEIPVDSVTRIGRFLRRAKLDELPQVLNIMRGELSLVGPRPCLPSQTELITERQKRGVFNAMPGITGYAQVRKCDMSEPERLAKLDQEYQSLKTLPLDLITIMRTVSG